MKKPFFNRLRFSIRDLLMVVTIILLATALWIANQELGELRTEVQQLRNEAGHLTISDPQKIHVIAAPTTGGYRWRWRVFLPTGKDYGLFVAKGAIPKNGLVSKNVGISKQRLGSKDVREFLLDVAVERNYDGAFVVSTRWSEYSSVICSIDESTPWIKGKSMVGWSVAGSKATENSAVGKPLVLLRLRTATKKRNSPSEGLMIWVADYK